MEAKLKLSAKEISNYHTFLLIDGVKKSEFNRAIIVFVRYLIYNDT